MKIKASRLAALAAVAIVETGGVAAATSAPPGSEPAGTESAATESAATGTPEDAAPVEGDITVWAMGTEGEQLGVLADAFEEEYPDVDVEVTAVPWDAAHDRLVTAIAGGEGPDVSLIGTTWMGEFATLGGLAPTPDTIDPSAFFEGAWQSTVVDGTSYGVPWYVETRLLYYRTDLAEQGGITEPPADWDGLTELVTALQEAGAENGISLQQPCCIGAWQTFAPFLWQAGGDIVDESNDFTLDSPECVEALTFYDSFFENGLARAETSDVPVEAQFADGSVGAFISGPWMINIITDAGADPETWTVAHQPTNVSGTSFVGGGNLAVFDQSDNQDAAWAFVEFASRPETQVLWYETVSDLPAVHAAWDDPALADDPLLAAFGEQLDDTKSPPAIPTWEEVASAIDGQIEQVTVGDTSPEDGCAAMQAEAESIGTGL
jgi:multiple sugar transport system substrate-binding protein